MFLPLSVEIPVCDTRVGTSVWRTEIDQAILDQRWPNSQPRAATLRAEDSQQPRDMEHQVRYLHDRYDGPSRINQHALVGTLPDLEHRQNIVPTSCQTHHLRRR